MLLAIVLFREASNQSYAAKVGVAWTVRNRVEHPSWYGTGWYGVITKKAQFTSMVPPDKMDDPNLRRYPNPADSAWAECWEVAQRVYNSDVADPTKGATFYHDRTRDNNLPKWATIYQRTAVIDDMRFYRPND